MRHSLSLPKLLRNHNLITAPTTTSALKQKHKLYKNLLFFVKNRKVLNYVQCLLSNNYSPSHTNNTKYTQLRKRNNHTLNFLKSMLLRSGNQVLLKPYLQNRTRPKKGLTGSFRFIRSKYENLKNMSIHSCNKQNFFNKKRSSLCFYKTPLILNHTRVTLPYYYKNLYLFTGKHSFLGNLKNSRRNRKETYNTLNTLSKITLTKTYFITNKFKKESDSFFRKSSTLVHVSKLTTKYPLVNNYLLPTKNTSPHTVLTCTQDYRPELSSQTTILKHKVVSCSVFA